jgi:hypothetical protein
MWVVLLAALGAAVGFVVVRRSIGRRRAGGILFALGLVVVLPLAALSIRAGRTSIDVVASRPPADSSAWRVNCESAVQGYEGDPFSAACHEATASWRATAAALTATSAVLVVIGAALVIGGNHRSPADAHAVPAS